MPDISILFYLAIAIVVILGAGSEIFTNNRNNAEHLPVRVAKKLLSQMEIAKRENDVM